MLSHIPTLCFLPARVLSPLQSHSNYTGCLNRGIKQFAWGDRGVKRRSEGKLWLGSNRLFMTCIKLHDMLYEHSREQGVGTTLRANRTSAIVNYLVVPPM